MRILGQDIVYALRQFRRTPAFTATAVLTLALGIGANALMFSVIDSVLLRPLPYADASRLIALSGLDAQGRDSAVSLPNFLDWRAQSRSFTGMAAYQPRSVSLQYASREPIHIAAIAASASLFDVLGVQPLLGRTFTGAEDQNGKPCVTVLSAGLWRQSFGSDRFIIGNSAVVDGSPCTIVGVMPEGFGFPNASDQGAWIPLLPTPQLMDRGTNFFEVVGRLRTGVTIETARRELSVILSRLQKAYPVDDAGTGIVATPYLDTLTDATRPALIALLGAVLLLLLITCANVANLQLARALGRKREFAIRAAMGAGRLRIAKQLLAESLLLAITGGIGGLTLASFSLDAIQRWGKDIVPRANEIQLHAEVCAAVIAAAVFTGILFGLAPILQTFRQDIEQTLRETAAALSTVRRQQRVRDLLVAGQLSLAIILLAGSGLLLRTLYHLLHEDKGFATGHVLTLQTAVSGNRYKDRDLAAVLYSPELDRIRALPGVHAAGFMTYLPLSNGHASGSFDIIGAPQDVKHQPHASLNSASEDLFQALGIPLLRGRFFSASDTQGSPRVAIVNDTLAQRYFPGGNALGKQVAFDDPDSVKHPLTIVGIVRGSKQRTLAKPAEPELYLSFRQIPPGTLWSDFLLKAIMTYVVRTDADPMTLSRAVTNTVHSMDSSQTVFHIATMDEIVSHSLESRRFTATLLGIFAALALIVAAAGLYALLSYTVGQRRREIAVRMALGARREHVIRSVVARAVRLYAIGLIVGILGAIWCGRLLSTMLSGVQPWDAMTLAGTAATLLVVSVLAAWIPARRAAAIDPMQVLRGE